MNRPALACALGLHALVAAMLLDMGPPRAVARDATRAAEAPDAKHGTTLAVVRPMAPTPGRRAAAPSPPALAAHERPPAPRLPRPPPIAAPDVIENLVESGPARTAAETMAAPTPMDPALALAMAPVVLEPSKSAPSTTPAEQSPPSEARAADRPSYQAATIAPEHGACSARGVERHYPAILRERGIEGRVLLRVQVDRQGRAAEVLIQSGSGWELLDEAARQVALGCPYVPARRGAEQIAAWIEYPVRFALGRPPP